MKTNTRRTLAAVVLPFALLVAACGSDSDGAASNDTTETTVAADNSSDTTAADDMGDDTEEAADAGAPEGDGCAAVPTDASDKGSFEGMAQDPVGTAASNNPALKTLVAAVTEAGLVDTLNGPGPFTVFAPIDSAFAKIPAADLDGVLADKDLLTSILTYHVLPERIEPADLAGTHTTVQGEDLVISGDAPSFDVADGSATVICSGVQTANATVYLIDSVLMPPAS
ncbi:MAG: fasciclin [Ilumatobacteraceae bacterium]|nr:fasciclin [Ilumatobacteraceae bacterium]